MNRRWMVLATALLVGCGGDGGKFASPEEELSYLAELTNPTPDQWKRRKSLQEELVEVPKRKEESRRLADERSARAKDETLRKREAASEKRKLDAIDQESREGWLTAAKKWEAAGDAAKAIEQLEHLVKEWPKSAEAETARAEIRRLKDRK